MKVDTYCKRIRFTSLGAASYKKIKIPKFLGNKLYKIPLKWKNFYSTSSNYKGHALYQLSNVSKVLISFGPNITIKPKLLINIHFEDGMNLNYSFIEDLLLSETLENYCFRISEMELVINFENVIFEEFIRQIWSPGWQGSYSPLYSSSSKKSDNPININGDFIYNRGSKNNLHLKAKKTSIKGIESAQILFLLSRRLLRKNNRNRPGDLLKGFDWVLNYIDWYNFDINYFFERYPWVPWLESTVNNYNIKDLKKIIQQNFTSLGKFENFLVELSTKKLTQKALKSYWDQFSIS